MRRSAWMLLSGLLLTTLSAVAQSPLDLLVQRALEQNPGLKAQRAKVSAAQRRPVQSKALPDPTAELEFMNIAVDGSSGSKAFTEGLSLGVTQMLPYPGKRGLAAKTAEGEADVEEARLQVMERMLRSEVLGAAFRYRTALDLLQINGQTEEALRTTAQSALARYSSGAGNQGDVLLAQASVTKVLTERTDLERQRDVAKARLESLLAGPVDESALGGIEVPAPAALPTLEVLLAFAGANAPEVAMARADAAVSETQAEAARKNFKPDFMVGGRYRYKDMTMGGQDYVTAMVGMTLPFFHRKDRYQPALEEALLRKQGALEGVSAAQNEARYRLAEAYQSADRNRKIFTLYDQGLTLQAQQAYEASLSAYRTGQSDFSALLMSLTNRFMYESDAAMARGEYHQMVAEMEAVLGRPLSEAAAAPQAKP